MEGSDSQKMCFGFADNKASLRKSILGHLSEIGSSQDHESLENICSWVFKYHDI